MLTIEQKACNAETLEHIRNVQKYLNLLVRQLLDRGEKHDSSKLESPEVELFEQVTSKLKGLTFGSDEYKESLKVLDPALSHHYAKNRHHPEHWKNGINDMNLIDIIEMFCDWKAATLRHHDGNLNKSIDIQAQRYNINSQLVEIFKNTVEIFE